MEDKSKNKGSKVIIVEVFQIIVKVFHSDNLKKGRSMWKCFKTVMVKKCFKVITQKRVVK